MKDLPNKSSLSHRFQYYLILSFSFLISLLPRKTMVKVGRFYGGLAYLIWKERREIAKANLDLAFGETKTEEEKEWIAREAFKNIGATFMEFGWGMRRMNKGVFAEMVEVEGVELLKVLPPERWKVQVGLWT